MKAHGQVVQVVWKDAYSSSNSWEAEGKTKADPHCLVHTVGHLTHIDGKSVQLVASITEVGSRGGLWVIPRGTVKSITPLVTKGRKK